MRKRHPAVAILAGALLGALPAGGQILLPREEIPADLRADVRAEIERLDSTDRLERRGAAIALGGMGRDAVPAIPFLCAVVNEVTFPVVGPLLTRGVASR